MRDQLDKNQVVLFEHCDKTWTEGYLEARFDSKRDCFYTYCEECHERIYSCKVVEKATKRAKFVPTKDNCTVQIHPVHETAKRYVVEDSDNGMVSRQNYKTFSKYIAKSICYIDSDGNVFAPFWAV